jgi:quercetin dioxygenase-like cupin family protein
LKSKSGEFFVGKVADFEKRKGWFFGHFAAEELLRSDLVEVAWQDISGKRGDPGDKHFHKNSVEINILISGWVRIIINGERVRLERGDFYVVYPYAVVEEIEAGENTELIVIRAPSLPGDKYPGEPANPTIT